MEEDEGFTEVEKMISNEGLPAFTKSGNKPIKPTQIRWNAETLHLEFMEGNSENKIDLRLYLYHNLVDRFGLEISIVSANLFLPKRKVFSFANSENREKLDLFLSRKKKQVKDVYYKRSQVHHRELERRGTLTEKETQSFFSRVGLNYEVKEYLKENDIKTFCLKEWSNLCNHMMTLETSEALKEIFVEFSTLFGENQLMTVDNLANFLSTYQEEKFERTPEELQCIIRNHTTEVRIVRLIDPVKEVEKGVWNVQDFCEFLLSAGNRLQVGLRHMTLARTPGRTG